MKLNYRDKIILGALLAFVVLLGGFFLLIKPKYTEIKDSKSKLAATQKEEKEVKDKIAEIEPLKKKIKETYDATTKLTDDFVDYNDIYNSRALDQYMQSFAEDNEVKILSLQVKEPSTSNLDYYYFKPTFVGEDMLKQSDLNGDKEKSLEADKAESEALKARTKESLISTSYTVNVEGERENIWNYLKALEEQDKTIIVDTASLKEIIIDEDEAKEQAEKDAADGKEKSVPQAQFTISLYSVYDLAEPNLEAD